MRAFSCIAGVIIVVVVSLKCQYFFLFFFILLLFFIFAHSDIAGQAKGGMFLCSDMRRMALRASVARTLSSLTDWPDDVFPSAACVVAFVVFLWVVFF